MIYGHSAERPRNDVSDCLVVVWAMQRAEDYKSFFFKSSLQSG